MNQFIDRRQNAGKKSAVNRQRFLRRYKNQLKTAVTDVIHKRRIKEINQGENISIPAKDILEPKFELGHGGINEKVLPGNDRFVKGDTIKKPTGRDPRRGSEASNSGDGQDDFVFQLSREEFLELYFEDLELPDLIAKELAKVKSYKNTRAGYTTSGTPTNINVLRSMKNATGRRMALSSPYKKELRQKEEELAQLVHDDDYEVRCKHLEERITYLKKKLNAVSFIDTIDLRFNKHVKVSIPSTNAVMFCIMDVSGSMDEAKKEIAKRFFILLYLFLTKNYEKIELVFIRHHTSAKEVNEEDFFYSRETGGTVVSSALELLADLINKRYSASHYNIYVAQASDGDNWNADSPYCAQLLNEKIMPHLQYFAYIEIMPRHHQSLWEVYEGVRSKSPNFAMENIDKLSDIYPVFRQLFKRKIG